MLPLSYVVATLMVPTSFAGHAAVVEAMGGVRDIAALDDERSSVDQRIGHLAMRAAANGRHRCTGDAHLLGDRLLVETFQVAQAQHLKLVDGHVDGITAGQAIGGEAAVFGDDPDAAQFFRVFLPCTLLI